MHRAEGDEEIGHGAQAAVAIRPTRSRPSVPDWLQRVRGTRLIGSEMRVSPSGLASRRSRAVNASMISGASNARLRRPTVICLRIPAETNRSMARLVAWNDRPIKSEAVFVVSSGARRRADRLKTHPARG